MVQGVMSWSVYYLLEDVTGDHVRVMDLERVVNLATIIQKLRTYENTPEVHQDEKDEVQYPVDRENEDEEVIRQ
jgi:hypothetical protein